MTTTRQFEFLTMSSGTYDVWRDTTSSPREYIVTSSCAGEWRVGAEQKTTCVYIDAPRKQSDCIETRPVPLHATPARRVY